MIKSFDTEKLREMFGEEQEIFFEILGDLIKSIPQMLTDITSSIENKDAKNLEYSAHNLKGVLANFCALNSKELAYDLEKAGKAQDFTGTDEKIDLLKVELKILVSELEHFKF